MISAGDGDHVKAEESERRREDSQKSCSTGGWTGKDHYLISLQPWIVMYPNIMPYIHIFINCPAHHLSWYHLDHSLPMKVKAKENGVAAPQNGNQSTKPPRLELEGKRFEAHYHLVTQPDPWLIQRAKDRYRVSQKNWVLPNWAFADLPQIS